MNKEEKDIEEEMDDLEDEIEEEAEEEAPVVKSKKPMTTKKNVKAPVQENEQKPTEKYVAFYQEAKIGIMDTLAGEVVVEGFQDVTTATMEAIKLNKLDKIEIASGAQ